MAVFGASRVPRRNALMTMVLTCCKGHLRAGRAVQNVTGRMEDLPWYQGLGREAARVRAGREDAVPSLRLPGGHGDRVSDRGPPRPWPREGCDELQESWPGGCALLLD